ncbi:hypothetical protein [Sphingomonas koreensis]
MTSTRDDTASPRRTRRPWSEEDDAELSRLIAERHPPGQIARQLRRTIDAVRGRAAHLNLVLPSSLRPWRSTVRRQPLNRE